MNDTTIFGVDYRGFISTSKNLSKNLQTNSICLTESINKEIQ